MIAGISLFDRGSGRWENTRKLVDSSGNLIKVSIAKDFTDALIRSENGQALAQFSGFNGRQAILQAVKNYLIDELGVKFPIDNEVRYADNLSLEETEDNQITLSNTPTSGTLVLDYDGDLTLPIGSDALTAENLQAQLRTIAGLESVEVYGNVQTGFTVAFIFVNNPESLTVDSSSLQVDEVQLITFSAEPDAGAFVLEYDGDTTGSIPFDATAQDIENELSALADLEAIEVTGNLVDGLIVTFTNVASPVLITVDTNTLTSDTDPVSIDVEQEVEQESTVVTIL